MTARSHAESFERQRQAVDSEAPLRSFTPVERRKVAGSGPVASAASEHAPSPGVVVQLFAESVGAGLHDGTRSLVQRAVDSPGASLPAPLMRTFEQSLDTDLSSVRVHTGSASASAAKSMSARAFATGQSIHFGAGQYDPSSASGQQLIAHEVAHTVQQRGAPSSTQHKLEISSRGDACESEADVAAEAMVIGAPASVSVGSARGIARWGEGEMDASVGADAAVDVPTVHGPPPVSIAIPPRDWLADARAVAAGLGDDSSSLSARTVTIGGTPAAIAEDPAYTRGWSELQSVAGEANDTWGTLQPRISSYLSLPTEFRVPGAGGMTMREVSAGTGSVDATTRTAAFDSPEFQAAARELRAAEHTLDAAVAESRAAAADLQSAHNGVERATQTALAHRAAARREGAEGRRADAVAGRSAELARIQNYIRIAEVGIGILAGGAGAFAAGSAAMAPAVAPTVAGSLRTAATSTVAGIGSNGLHDLAVGALAEAFVSGNWDRRIAEADREIVAATRQIRAASSAADQAAIDEALSHETAASQHMTATSSTVRSAQQQYQARVLALASVSGRALGGPQGRQMQGALAALLPVQSRLARLAELRAMARVPGYTEGSGWAYALLRSEELGPSLPGQDLVNLVARLIYMQDNFLPRELATWQAREREITTMLNTVAPDDSLAGR
jgi:hypothetical protein